MGTGTNNVAIAELALLGQCQTLKPTSFIFANELTTVAAVAVLSPYMTSATNVGSGTADAQSLASAFALASQFANVSSGTVPGLGLSAGYAVPEQEMNTLADILAACINTTGGIVGDGSNCGNLFKYATPPGGVAPVDTVVALLDILTNPTSNIASLLTLVSATSPFQPTLAVPPPFWSVVLSTTTRNYDYQMVYLPSYGQSLAFGSTAVPVISTTQPWDSLMFVGGVIAQAGSTNGGIDPTLYASLMPLVEQNWEPAPNATYLGNDGNPLGETPVSGALNTIKSQILAEDNLEPADKLYQFVGSAPAKGGTDISGLTRGTAPYNRVLSEVTYAMGFAAAPEQDLWRPRHSLDPGRIKRFEQHVAYHLCQTTDDSIQ